MLHSLLLIVIDDVFLELADIEFAPSLEPFKVTVLLLVLIRELVEHRVKLASQARASECLQKIWRSNDLLNYPITLFFIVQVLFESVHVTSFKDFDNSHGVSHFVDKTFPSTENEGCSDASTN